MECGSRAAGPGLERPILASRQTCACLVAASQSYNLFLIYLLCRSGAPLVSLVSGESYPALHPDNFIGRFIVVCLSCLALVVYLFSCFIRIETTKPDNTINKQRTALSVDQAAPRDAEDATSPRPPAERARLKETRRFEQEFTTANNNNTCNVQTGRNKTPNRKPNQTD